MENSGGGDSLAKSRLVLEVVRHYAFNHPGITLAELKGIFPDALQGGTFGVFAPLESAGADNFKGYKRYMTNDNDIINLQDGAIAVTNQWHKDNIGAFIVCSRRLGYEITETTSTE